MVAATVAGLRFRPPSAQTNTPHPIAYEMRHMIRTAFYALLFFAVITPVAWILRVSGWNRLALRFEPARDSYWTTRAHPGTDAGTMTRQS